MLDISLDPLSISDQFSVPRRKKGRKKALTECRGKKKKRIFKILFVGIFKSLTADPWER